MWDFFAENWQTILLGLITFLGTFTAVTESKDDDKWLDVAKRILNAILLGKPSK